MGAPARLAGQNKNTPTFVEVFSAFGYFFLNTEVCAEDPQSHPRLTCSWFNTGRSSAPLFLGSLTFGQFPWSPMYPTRPTLRVLSPLRCCVVLPLEQLYYITFIWKNNVKYGKVSYHFGWPARGTIKSCLLQPFQKSLYP